MRFTPTTQSYMPTPAAQAQARFGCCHWAMTLQRVGYAQGTSLYRAYHSPFEKYV